MASPLTGDKCVQISLRRQHQYWQCTPSEKKSTNTQNQIQLHHHMIRKGLRTNTRENSESASSDEAFCENSAGASSAFVKQSLLSFCWYLEFLFQICGFGYLHCISEHWFVHWQYIWCRWIHWKWTWNLCQAGHGFNENCWRQLIAILRMLCGLFRAE